MKRAKTTRRAVSRRRNAELAALKADDSLQAQTAWRERLEEAPNLIWELIGDISRIEVTLQFGKLRPTEPPDVRRLRPTWPYFVSPDGRAPHPAKFNKNVLVIPVKWCERYLNKEGLDVLRATEKLRRAR